MKDNVCFLNKVARGLLTINLTVKVAILLIAAIMLLPQTTQAYDYPWEDFESSYPFWTNLHYETNGDNPYIEWETVLWDDCGDDEGFFKDDDHKNGLKVEMKIGSGSKVNCGYLACDGAGTSRELYHEGNAVGNSNVSWGYGGRWEFNYRKTSYKNKKEEHGIHTIKPRWYIPLEYRNTVITIYVSGSWMKWNKKKGEHEVNESARIVCPYAHTVRDVFWNGEYTVSPDGTVTIPYKFSSTGCNTDGHTHLCTKINGWYSNAIGIKELSNYNNGSYTFNLSDIGGSFTSSFTIQPYHEYKHPNDKDANNGNKYYTTQAELKNFMPLPKATIKNVAFHLEEKKVSLTWSASNSNYGNGKWVIYRNGTKIAAVNQDIYSYDDTTAPTESNVTYTIYYVMNGWNETTQVDKLKSNEKSVNTERRVPILGFNSGSQADRIVLTWRANALPAGWGNSFKIYVDNETAPIYTVTPSDRQTFFRWEHRNNTEHQDRRNGTDGSTCYTEEPLNATNPHSYRIESAIGSLVRDTVSTGKMSIGTGTTFYSLEASKNAYAGQVKVSWHVNRQGTNASQTYTIYRRRAEKNTETWTQLDRFSSTDDYLSYIDNTPLPGTCYDYRVQLEEQRPDGTVFTKDTADVGYSQASATISGRITFGTSGMAVANVDVIAKPIIENEESEGQYHAARFTGENGQLTWKYPSQNYVQETFINNDWTIQMWINPDSIKEQLILKMGHYFEFRMKADGKSFCWLGYGHTFGPQYAANEYQHLTIAKDNDSIRMWLVNSKGNVQYKKMEWPSDLNIRPTEDLIIGGFKGYVDEFRMWTRCLSEAEIRDNYNRTLAGNERNLELYWTFDEGLNTRCFDYSRNGTVYRSHHGMFGVNTESSVFIPDSLELRARTDSVGNYVIRGVPYSGEGVVYAIIPKLGTHQFNPTQQLRFVSANSLVHNGTDFDDVSSFLVSGTVYYAGTNYPVEGCNLYVDGQICSKDGEIIETNSDGQYNISVPIGEHFIHVKKQGHEFVNNGRYPKEAGQYINFDREISNLTFYDSTMVNFTGRVTGGEVEEAKAVGFGLSKNNIGVATLTLMPRNIENSRYFINAVLPTEGTVIQYEPNPAKETIASASPDTIRSSAWRGYGNQDECKKIYIRTDSATGEFSAMLPPLDYMVTSVYVKSDSLELLNQAVAVDMTNALVTNKDSARSADGTMQYYEYHSILRATYRSKPIFNVAQWGHTDGSFGIDEYEISDAFGILKLTDIYHSNANGNVEYTYGYPLFEMNEIYRFDIEGYEEYVNHDVATNPVTSRVPLSGVTVTIDNALSTGKSIYTIDNDEGKEPGTMADLQSNQLKLDSLGKAIYLWEGGFPNTKDAHTCDLNMSYDINGRNYMWREQPLTGIVLGGVPSGTNFVTGGPDNVLMVLRDPPGSQSYATWEKGTTTRRLTINKNEDGYFNETGTAKINVGFNSMEGAGIGMMMLTSFEVIAEGTAGTHITVERTSGTSCDVSMTVTEAISTSDSPEFDGADGDVFFGLGTNLLFGKSINVGLYRNPLDTSSAFIDVREAATTDLTFTTTFAYTQHYIEHYLIPNLKMLRNSLFTPIATAADTAGYNNNTGKPVYLNWLPSSNKNYGQKGYYHMVLHNGADSTKTYLDSVSYYNTQIDSWEQQLSKNEEEKMAANIERATLESAGKMKNYSFDAGSVITNSYARDSLIGTTKDTVKTYHGILAVRGGWLINKNVGLIGESTTEFGANDEDNPSYDHHSETDTTQTAVFSYTLKDTDPTDAISVDVFREYGRYGSPIFRTRGGQTSNPYEDEVLSKHFQPNGHVIMVKTMQVEKPQIEAEPRSVSNVPSGSAANYTLKLRNLSEINADCTYKLYLMEQSNMHGAQILIDGMPLTGDGRLIYVPYGQGQTVVKSMQLKQSDMGILNYENIGIILASQHQNSIADTVMISAQFVPSSSPVTLAVNTNTINTHTDTVLILTMKDFDRNYYNLKAFRLQYKSQGGSWTNLQEYVLDASHLSSNQQLLPNDMNVVYRLSMKNQKSWPDGTYTFRIVSVSTYGTDEVYVFSNEEEVIKDTSYPRPLGQAEPADGILDIGDELSITYNMPFVNGALSPENFIVTGVLNGAPVEHLTALRTYNDTAKANAVTEANINLSDKDFSLDAWLNIHSAGTLLRHGNGKKTMAIGTDETGHLVVSLFGDSVVLTSTAVVPRNKWVFFSFSRKVVNAQEGKINAVVVTEDSEIYPFTDVVVPSYQGNGPLAVGCGAEAAIHEVLLWDEVRDIYTALAQRSVTKNPATRHLIGYWKMDEGEGKTLRDYARNRHMVMPAESWYLNNVNKAVMLDGTQHLAISTATVPPMLIDDYAMEFWMQGGAQTDIAQLVQLGDVSMWIDANGRLHLQSGESQWAITNNQAPIINNNQWHHVMLNVRRFGTAAVYIDGTRVITISASDIGDFASDSLIVGARRIYVPETGSTVAHYTYDRLFTGSVDEIRLWKTTIASDLLASKRKTRLTGQEPGLSLYYPFENKQLAEYGQIVTMGTAQEMTGNGTPATLNSQLSTLNYTDDAPALQEKPTQTNVGFAFTSSDTKIVIDVTEAPARIEGCMLYFTVRDVRSINGNNSQPAIWSAFIHRNELAWQDEDLTVVKREDESYTVTTSLVNRSGTPQRWSLSDLPTSLTASSTSGMLNPLEREEITFVVDETAPIGKHERTIYAMGNNGVLTPITLHLTVTGDVPEWTVNPSAYPFSMDVIGQLDVFGKISENEDDMVAAFIDDECRGVAHPKYMERYDGYFVTLTISGNDVDNNKPISFRAYDASTGITYTQVAPDSIQYHSLSIIGRYNAPELFSVKDLIEQSIQLKKGWNWISLYVTADNMSPTAILDGIKEDVELIKGQTGREGFMMYSYDMWGGSMANLTNSKMYSVKMRNDRTLRVVGQHVNVSLCPIELAPQWNWIGYCSDKRMNIGTALADMDPLSEDLILSQRGMAYYDDYEWVGSLSELQPGSGYIVFNSSGQTKHFTYPSQSVAAAPARLMASTATVEPVVGSAYPYNMVLFAQVTGDGKPLEQVQLLIFAGEECRAAGVTDENGRVNLLIPGEELTGLSFRVVVGDKTYDATETLNYETDAIVGTPEAPFLIDLKGITGLFGTQAGTQKTGTYDVLGRRLPEGHHLPQGVYIINGKKVVR